MRGPHAARAVVLIVSSCCGTWASADPSDGIARSLAEQGSATVPSGLANLCGRSPALCAPASEAMSAPLPLAGSAALLSRVNTTVNQAIASTTDRALYGRDEYWALPTTAGDCEDYVLMKRQTLMQMGVPQGLLLITVVRDENGETHAVLTVPTTRGDVVLDNRRDEILPWWKTGYTFVKRQSESSPLQWVSLEAEKLQATNIASGPGLP